MNSLYIVATPIGNLKDLSPRAVEVLNLVDSVYCEDTRVTRKLLQAYDIETETHSLHQHSTASEVEKVVKKLESEESIAYVSDAGTPGISDPGGKLVAVAVKAGINIVPIPGPSALVTALCVCGFPTDTFTFIGFPPNKKGRNKFFEKLASIEHAVALYESKHRILKTLTELPQDRQMLVARELTKMHETLYRGTAPEVLKELESTSQKGEFVIVLAPKNWTI